MPQQKSSAGKILLTIVIIVAIAVAGAYSYFWFDAKHKTEQVLAKISEDEQLGEFELNYSINGFPMNYRVTLTDVKVVPSEAIKAALAKRAEESPNLEGAQYDLVTTEGDLVIDMPVFGKEMTVSFPDKITMHRGEQSLTANYKGDAILALGYDFPNYKFYSYLEKWEKVEGKEIVQDFRYFSYEDAGSRAESNDGKHYIENDGVKILVAMEPSNGTRELSFKFNVENANYSDDYYQWQQLDFEKVQLPEGMIKTLFEYALDYRFYDAPLSIALDASLTLEGDEWSKESSKNGQFVLNRYSLRDGLGESVHTGQLTFAEKDSRPKLVSGNYTITIENYAASLDRYLTFTDEAFGIVYEGKDEMNALLAATGKPQPKLPEPQWVSDFIELFKTQFAAAAQAIGAVEGTTFKLALVQNEGEPMPMLNGTPAMQQLPVVMQYFQPVMIKAAELQQMQQQQTTPEAQGKDLSQAK